MFVNTDTLWRLLIIPQLPKDLNIFQLRFGVERKSYIIPTELQKVIFIISFADSDTLISILSINQIEVWERSNIYA